MTVRFLADENLDADIIQGLRSREPAIDILDVKTAGLRGATDPALLELAVRQDRVLIAYDRNTIDAVLSGPPRCGEANLRPVYCSPAERRHRRDHRVAASRMDRFATGRMAESDRVFAVPLKRKWHGAHHRTCEEPLRAALRFARVPLKMASLRESSAEKSCRRFGNQKSPARAGYLACSVSR